MQRQETLNREEVRALLGLDFPETVRGRRDPERRSDRDRGGPRHGGDGTLAALITLAPRLSESLQRLIGVR